MLDTSRPDQGTDRHNFPILDSTFYLFIKDTFSLLNSVNVGHQPKTKYYSFPLHRAIVGVVVMKREFISGRFPVCIYDIIFYLLDKILIAKYVLYVPSPTQQLIGS